MGEEIWVNIEFRVPSSWDMEQHLAAYFDYFDDELDGITTYQMNGPGNWGLEDGDIERFLNWLASQRVPFIANQEAKYEYEPELRVHDGYTLFCRHGTLGPPAMTRKDWEALWLDICANDRMTAEAIDEWFDAADKADAIYHRPIDQFDISHLSAWPAPDPEEALTFDECEAAGLDGTLIQIGAS